MPLMTYCALRKQPGIAWVISGYFGFLPGTPHVCGAKPRFSSKRIRQFPSVAFINGCALSLRNHLASGRLHEGQACEESGTVLRARPPCF